MKNIDITPQEAPAPLPKVHKPRLRFDLDSQQWTTAAAPEADLASQQFDINKFFGDAKYRATKRDEWAKNEREEKARKFDRVAAEYRADAAAACAIKATSKGEQRRAAMRAGYYAEFCAKEAARKATLLRETEQQRQEREAREAIERKLQRPCPNCGGRGRSYSEAERIERIRTSALNRRAYWCGL